MLTGLSPQEWAGVILSNKRASSSKAEHITLGVAQPASADGFHHNSRRTSLQHSGKAIDLTLFLLPESAMDAAESSPSRHSHAGKAEADKLRENFAFADFWVGAAVSHVDHGQGRVECFLPDGRIKTQQVIEALNLGLIN